MRNDTNIKEHSVQRRTDHQQPGRLGEFGMLLRGESSVYIGKNGGIRQRVGRADQAMTPYSF